MNRFAEWFNSIEIGPIKAEHVEIPGKLVALIVLAVLIGFLSALCGRTFFDDAQPIGPEGPDPYRVPKAVDSKRFTETAWTLWSDREAYGRLSTPV